MSFVVRDGSVVLELAPPLRGLRNEGKTMLRRCTWGLLVLVCIGCESSGTDTEVVGVAEQHVWRSPTSTQSNTPGLAYPQGGWCTAVLLTPQLAITANHCDGVLPVSDGAGGLLYTVLGHPQSSLWSGLPRPRVTRTWAPKMTGDVDRFRDFRFLMFDDSNAPLTVFPQRTRYLDSPAIRNPLYPTGPALSLPVIWMGWGDTEFGHTTAVLREQRGYSFGHELLFGVIADSTNYRHWVANLGPVSTYNGPASGDSGAPLFKPLSKTETNEFELIGLSSGDDLDDKGLDPRVIDAVRAAMAPADKAIADAKQVTYRWTDVTSLPFFDALWYQARDPQRPGRLFGERDYYGPVRKDLDPDGDHFYGLPNASCPMYFYDQRGGYGELTEQGQVNFVPELANRLPALHAYRSLFVNDRTHVYGPTSGTWGNIVLGSHESRLLDSTWIQGRIGTDAEIGSFYGEGGGTFAVSDRSNVRFAWWDGLNVTAASTASIKNTPGPGTVRIPQSRLMKQFPYRAYGTAPNVTQIPIASRYAGPCNNTSFCHYYQSIEPNQKVTLQPGFYGDLSIKSGSTLTLSGGDYFFDGLSTESGSYLVVAPGASARVWVRDTLSLRNYGNMKRAVDPATGQTVVVDTSAAANLFIGYYGTQDTSVWELTGTLVAPYVKVSLETNRNPATAHAGMVIANHIELHQGNSFYQVPYQCR